jgi:hypothetical protein
MAKPLNHPGMDASENFLERIIDARELRKPAAHTGDYEREQRLHLAGRADCTDEEQTHVAVRRPPVVARSPNQAFNC